MNSTGIHPEPRLLKVFHTLRNLEEEQLSLLAGSLEIHRAAKGQVVIKRGDTRAFSFLLLKGEIELAAGDGRRKRLKAGTESTRNPIAQLLPRRFDIIARTNIAYLVVDSQLLESLHQTSQQNLDSSSMLVEETSEPIHSDSSADEHGFLAKLSEDLEHDDLMLPSLPDVALRIGRALNDGVSDARDIAQIIQTDPAITAKIIKTANSAFYAGRDPVDNSVMAVVRLGTGTTHKLVLGFALREVFRSRNSRMQRLMQQLLDHSKKVAAICYVLAKITHKFNPEHAMLAGLVHDIGVVAILNYADRFPNLAGSDEHINYAITHLRGEVGGLILEKWNFEEDFIVAAREGELWTRDPNPEPEYCDLVLVAQLHSYVGTPRMEELPHLGEIPCFAKLGLGELTPRQSLKILDKAGEQLTQAENLLS